MTKNELIEAVATEADLSEAGARRFVDALFPLIARTVIDGEEVILPELGKLRRVATPARQGRNPRTGASLDIAAGYRIGFHPSGPLKTRLAELPVTAARKSA